jgi:hypothetical protein
MITQDADATVVSDAACVTITKAFYSLKTGEVRVLGGGSWFRHTSYAHLVHNLRLSSRVGAGSVCSRVGLNVGLNMGLNWRENRQLLPPSSSSVTRFLLRFVSTSTPG